MYGIDVSNNNGGAFDDGTEFAFLKTSEGTGFSDGWFGRYRDKCGALGVPWGGYHFPHPDASTPEAEVAKFLSSSTTGPVGWALDVESRNVGGRSIDPLAIMGAAGLASWCDRFLSLVADQRGPSWFYCNRSYADALYPHLSSDWRKWLATLNGHPIVPQVGGVPTYAGHQIDVEQFAIVGGLDRNISYTGLIGPTTPKETPMAPSIGQFANGELVVLPDAGAKPWITGKDDASLVAVLVFRVLDPDPAKRYPFPNPIPVIDGAHETTVRAWVAAGGGGSGGGSGPSVAEILDGMSQRLSG